MKGKHGDDAACLKANARGTELPSRRGRCRSLASSRDGWCNICATVRRTIIVEMRDKHYSIFGG